MPRVSRCVCPVCGEERDMLTIRHAAEVVGVSFRTIYRWIEREKVHSLRVASGQWRICKDSLFLGDQRRQKRRESFEALN
jgi:excisionase family DNA binding protein